MILSWIAFIRGADVDNNQISDEFDYGGSASCNIRSQPILSVLGSYFNLKASNFVPEPRLTYRLNILQKYTLKVSYLLIIIA